MSAFLRLISMLAKYGKRAVDWAWKNKDRILRWITDGMAIEWIINQIKKILGIK